MNVNFNQSKGEHNGTPPLHKTMLYGIHVLIQFIKLGQHRDMTPEASEFEGLAQVGAAQD